MTDDVDGLTVVTEPSSGNPGRAGVGVRYTPDQRYSNERVTVEQLWPNGDADEVYVPEEDLGELIHQLMEVHLAVMDREDHR